MKEETEFKRTSQLVSNWYQSYYQFMVLSINDPRSANSDPRALNTNLTDISWSTQYTGPSINPQPIQNQQNHVQNIYKVPSLVRRFTAECFDAFYIQCFKIALALMILNYTDLM